MPPNHSFKLMTFNIEYGGTNVSFEKVVETIQKANPDVVAIEEAFGNIPRLAKDLGWKFYDTRLQIVSQLPLLDPPDGNGIYTFVEIEAGKVIALSNVHLPNDPEGIVAALRGATEAELIELENKARLPFIQGHLEILHHLAEQGIPVFLAGDFNAPSHLDWTEAMIDSRPQIRFAMPWPVSKAVEQAGFRDSYRDVYPDPKTHPGLTHWAARPQVTGWNPKADDPHERIDYIYGMGNVKTLESLVIGEEFITPWASDHRAVMSVFEVEPATPPVFVSTPNRLIEVEAWIKVNYHGSGSGGERIAVVRNGEAQPVMSHAVDQSDGQFCFSSNSIQRGGYDLALMNERDEIIARYPFWVKAVEEGVTLNLDKDNYTAGETIIATWENAPGNRWDWIGIYKAGQDPFAEKPLYYKHTAATINGTCVFENLFLPAGMYELLFCMDDDYVCLTRVGFVVKQKIT